MSKVESQEVKDGRVTLLPLTISCRGVSYTSPACLPSSTHCPLCCDISQTHSYKPYTQDTEEARPIIKAFLMDQSCKIQDATDYLCGSGKTQHNTTASEPNAKLPFLAISIFKSCSWLANGSWDSVPSDWQNQLGR